MPSTTALMFHRILLILKNNRSFLYSYKPLRFHEDTIPAHGSFVLLFLKILKTQAVFLDHVLKTHFYRLNSLLMEQQNSQSLQTVQLTFYALPHLNIFSNQIMSGGIVFLSFQNMPQILFLSFLSVCWKYSHSAAILLKEKSAD